MTKHSPGPWTFDAGMREIVDAKGCAFVQLDTGWYFKEEDPRRVANIALIAAAPEMLTLLRRWVSGVAPDNARAEAEAFIARIDGEEP